MVVVAELPRVVRYHEEAVSQRADNIVEQRVARERSVTTVVAGDEQSEEERTLDEPVEDDGGGSQYERLSH